MKSLFVLLIVLCFTCIVKSKRVCNVKDWGAKGDGKTLDSPAINKAIASDECHTIWFPDGAYVSGTIRILKNDKTLFLTKGATILGAKQGINAYDHWVKNPYDMYQDFGHCHWKDSLIYAENVTGLSIEGDGLIDGNELHTAGPIPKGDGDKLFGIVSCERVLIRGVRISRTGHFALLATNVTDLRLIDLFVRPMRDGFDIVSCNNVEVRRCDIQHGDDDALVFKSDYSLGAIIDMFDVLVTDCTTATNGATAIEIGSETVGDFYNIRVQNHVVKHAGDAAIGMAIMDGANVYDIVYTNISASDVTSPFQLYIGARGSHPPNVGRKVGSIKNVLFEDIYIVHCFDSNRDRNWTFTIDGQNMNHSIGVPQDHFVGPNIVFHNVNMQHCPVGGGWPISQPPTLPQHEPLKWFNIGPRPAYGIFIRHAIDVHFNHVKSGFMAPDQRPCVFLQDAHNIDFDTFSALRGKGVSYDIAVGRNVTNVSVVNSPNIVVKEVN